jgi:hypothetical protein
MRAALARGAIASRRCFDKHFARRGLAHFVQNAIVSSHNKFIRIEGRCGGDQLRG